ncbi:hypothetical protein DZC75_21450 [Pseudomonas parafulva]|uniref:Uncharacterized protein n=1 Tax=Pseudomonas parafulva TaxID=157782 RepID=A0AAI8KCM1_9PSED|nr:hypothetical protein DZC75_21450 [Pseudomonas parafulva]
MAYLLADESAAHTMLLLLTPLGHVDSILGGALHVRSKLETCICAGLPPSCGCSIMAASRPLGKTDILRPQRRRSRPCTVFRYCC